MLRAADLFLLTTEPPESFGIVLIEAMACGLPAIATDYPGVRAVVDDGVTGAARAAPATRAAVAAALDRLVAVGDRGATRDGRSADARRRSASGAGRACSTAWTTPTREAIAVRGGHAP